MVEIPQGATHSAEYYGETIFYRLTHGLHYNTVIDHPEECWQRTDIWHTWERGQWVCVGSGFSARRLQLLQLPQHTTVAV